MEASNLKKGPHGIALELVDGSHSMIELWDHVTDWIEIEDWDRLYIAIDPEYEEKLQKQHALCERVEQALPSEESREAFRNYSDQCVQELNIRKQANFILGVAVGQRLSNPVCS